MDRVVLEGIPVVEGAAVGKLFYLNTDYSEAMAAYVPGEPAAEADRFAKALAAAKSGLAEALTKDTSDEEKAIIEVHLMLIEDEGFTDMVGSFIEEGMGAPDAVKESVSTFKAMFAELDDEYLRDRANDIVDVGNRILRKLLGISEADISGENLILMAEDIEPALMASLSENMVNAVLLENGSKTSHTIIIAKSKGFVTMVGVKAEKPAELDGEDVIVDTASRQAIVAPLPDELEGFKETVVKQQERKRYLVSKACEPAVSKDGREFTVAANVSSPSEMEKAKAMGCKGVGLYRTEFLFMDSAELPDEEKQTKAYEELLSAADGELCIIRTLDIGGDKHCESLGLEAEDNPFLGYRAVRICLDRKDMFKTQLRALLRASASGKLGIMIPMIDTVTEIREAKELLLEAKNELDAEGIAYDREVRFGIMTETPASALMAPILAKYVDFFSIGTNDLVQYTMAVDRGNQKVSYLYDYFDPAVIRAIAAIVSAAHEAGIMVGMCGEMAGDPLAAPFLTAIGLDEFSMSVSAAPQLKETIRNLSTVACDMEKLMSLESAKEVRDHLAKLC